MNRDGLNILIASTNMLDSNNVFEKNLKERLEDAIPSQLQRI